MEQNLMPESLKKTERNGEGFKGQIVPAVAAGG